MSHWLLRALTAIGQMPGPLAVPNVPIVPKRPLAAETGTFGTIGTIGTHDAEVACSDFEERAALIEFGANVPREWAEGFAKLNLSAPPPGYAHGPWRQLIDDAGLFLDRWAQEAIALGWSVEHVFGLDPAKPETGYEAMGLVAFIRGGTVQAIGECTASIQPRQGGLLLYIRRNSQAAVPAWDLVTSDHTVRKQKPSPSCS